MLNSFFSICRSLAASKSKLNWWSKNAISGIFDEYKMIGVETKDRCRAKSTARGRTRAHSNQFMIKIFRLRAFKSIRNK